MKVNVMFENYTKSVVNIPEMKLFWQGSYQNVPLQLRSMEKREIPVDLDHLFAPFSKISYRLNNGKMQIKTTERKDWRKIDPLRGKPNVVLFINNTDSTAVFREEDIPGTSGIRIPPQMRIKRQMQGKGRFKNCIRIEINVEMVKGMATVNPTLVPHFSHNYVYKKEKQ